MADFIDIANQAEDGIISGKEFESFSKRRLVETLGFSEELASRMFARAFSDGKTYGYIEIGYILEDLVDMVLGDNSKMPDSTKYL